MEWLKDFVLQNRPKNELDNTAKQMFAFLKDYLHVSVSTPEILAAALDQVAWIGLWEHWMCFDSFKLDSGLKLSLMESMEHWKSTIYGTTLTITLLRELDFNYDFLVFVNESLIERTMRLGAKSNHYLQAMSKFRSELILMHEIFHVYEHLLGKKLIKGDPSPLGEDPFVVEAFEAFATHRDSDKKDRQKS